MENPEVAAYYWEMSALLEREPKVAANEAK